MDNLQNGIAGIKDLTIGGFKWYGSLMAVRDIMAFAVNIVLARILLPSDFGLVALVFVVSGLLLTIVEIGFNAAVIQKKTINDEILSTAFFINLVMSALVAVLVIVISPQIGIFFNNEAIIPMIRFFSIVLIIRALSSIQVAVNERNLNFRMIAFVTLAGIIVATLIKLYLAYSGYGAWSIIIGELFNHLLVTVLFWIRTPWVPVIKNIKHSHFRELLSYGSNIMLIRFFNQLSSKFDIMIIGRFISAYDLGIYSMGFKISTIIPSQVNTVIARVMFPSFSRMQDNNTLMIRAYLEVIKYISIVGLPMVVGLIIITPEFVSVVLTEKWLSAIPIIQMLCIFSIANIIGGALWGPILKAKGKPRLVLVMTVIRLIAMPVFIIGGLRWGLIGITAGIAIYGWIFRFVYQYIVNKEIGISMLDYLKSLAPAFINAALMAALVYLVISLMRDLIIAEIFVLLTAIVLGVLSYVLSLYLLNRHEYNELKVIFMSFIRNSKKYDSQIEI